MDVQTINLTAGDPVRMHVPHRFFVLLAATAPVTVRKLNPRALSIEGEVGRDVESGYMYWPLDPADRTRVWGGYELLSAVNQEVRIATSFEAGDYRRFVTTVVQAAVANLSDVTDIAVSTVAVEVAAASTVNRVVYVQNVGGENVRVGTSAVTSTRGTRLLPNGSRAFRTRAAIYAIREGGADSSVAVSTESE